MQSDKMELAKVLAMRVAAALRTSDTELDRAAVHTAKGREIDAARKASTLRACADVFGLGRLYSERS